MKLLKTEEIKSSRESQNFKDVMRTQQVKETLKEANTQLSDVEARFDTTLSKQRVIWAKEEEASLKRLEEIETEIKAKETYRDSLLLPIEEEKKKAHDLFKEAERILESARITKREADEAKASAEELQELLTNKIDGLSERELKVAERETKAVLERKSLDQERQTIKTLSAELTNKLNTL